MLYTNDLYWTKATPFLKADETAFIERIEYELPTFEVTGDVTNVCKMYFDIDYKIDNDECFSDKINTVICNTGKKFINECITQILEVDPIIAVATASYEKKYSWRYFVPNIKMKKNEMLEFIIHMNKYIEAKSDIYDYIDNDGKGLFDLSIYDHNRKMRCINTSKPNQNRPLKLVEGSIADTFITGFLDNANLVTYGAKPKIQVPNGSPTSVADTNLFKDTASTSDLIKKDKFLDLLFNVIGNGSYIDYTTWFKIAATLKSNGYPFKILEEYTNIYDSNNPKTENVWNNLCANKPISIHGLQNIAKKINPDKYFIWLKENNEYLTIDIACKGENDISKFVAKKLLQKLVFCKKEWYYRGKNNIWSIIEDPCAYIVSHVQDELDILAKIQTDKLAKCNGDEDEKESLRKICKFIHDLRAGACKAMGSYRTLMKTYLLDNDFSNKLDINKYEIAYKNGILNLKTLQFTEGFDETQFISKTLPFNYEVASESDKQFVKNELKKICNNNQDHLEFYLSVFGYALTGDAERLQEFYYYRGEKACNGKSIIFEVLTEIMPNYVSKFGRDTFDKKNTTLHKDIAMWRGVRIGWSNEIVNKVDAELLKDAADGKGIKFKGLYKNADDMPVSFKIFIVSNHSPTIDSDAGVKRRLRIGQFDSEFVENLEKDDYDNCRFKRDNSFGINLREKYKHALLALLFDYSKKFYDNNYKLAEYPDEWKEEVNIALAQNDPFKEWFEQYFEFGEGEDFIITEYKLKQIMKSNKFENVKIGDQVKKNKWKCKRCKEEKTWIGIRMIEKE